MIRKMMPRDIDAVIELTDQERWRYGPEDIRRLMRMDPEGCLILGDKPEGCVFAISMGTKGVIGGLIVDFSIRGQGSGNALMEAAITHLEPLSETMELFSYEHTVPFYRRMGFREAEHVARMVGQVKSLPEMPGAVPAGPVDLDRIASYDAPIFGGDRRPMLDDLMRTGLAVCGEGYGMAKGSPKDCFDIGPVVCGDATMWRAVMNRLPPSCVEVSIPEDREDALVEAESSGMTLSFRNVRMTMGRHTPLHPMIWAIGGLEKG